MEERNKLKEKAALSGDSDDYDAYKRKRNLVTKLLKTAEKDYHSEKFNEDELSKTIWRTAFDILGTQRTSFPSQIFLMGQLISSPKDIAAAVNEFFVSKIAKLKEQSVHDVSEEDPISELKTYLSRKEVPEDGFRLRELDDVDMKKLLLNLKGKKASGMDWICGYSLKIASPII